MRYVLYIYNGGPTNGINSFNTYVYCNAILKFNIKVTIQVQVFTQKLLDLPGVCVKWTRNFFLKGVRIYWDIFGVVFAMVHIY
jgi:hypothetical protein